MTKGGTRLVGTGSNPKDTQNDSLVGTDGVFNRSMDEEPDNANVYRSVDAWTRAGSRRHTIRDLAQLNRFALAGTRVNRFWTEVEPGDAWALSKTTITPLVTNQGILATAGRNGRSERYAPSVLPPIVLNSWPRRVAGIQPGAPLGYERLAHCALSG